MITTLKAIGIGLLAAIIHVAPSNAHEGATGIVKERMTVMKEIGDATKTLAKMAKGETDFSTEQVESLIALISERAAMDPMHLFPPDSLDHPTEALPEIWEDWPTFTAYWRDMQKAATPFGANGPESREALMGALADLSKSCRSCHDDFRKE